MSVLVPILKQGLWQRPHVPEEVPEELQGHLSQEDYQQVKGELDQLVQRAAKARRFALIRGLVLFLVFLAAAIPFMVFAPCSAHGAVPGASGAPALGPAERARRLVARMTVAEKLSMLHGPAGGSAQCSVSPRCAYVGNVAPIERLGIPPINMNDGPQGFRTADAQKGTSTAWPAGITLAASWDEAAALEWGRGMGKEFYDKGSRRSPRFGTLRSAWFFSFSFLVMKHLNTIFVCY
eukprot:g4156.t1